MEIKINAEYLDELSNSLISGKLISGVRRDEYINGEYFNTYYTLPGSPIEEWMEGLCTNETEVKFRYLGEENSDTPSNSSAGERIRVELLDNRKFMHFECFFWAEIISNPESQRQQDIVNNHQDDEQ